MQLGMLKLEVARENTCLVYLLNSLENAMEYNSQIGPGSLKGGGR